MNWDFNKKLIFPGRSEQGIFTHVIDCERAFLEKTASEYHPTIGAYINQAKTIKGKTQILLTALGAGEYWGANVNADYFPEAALAHEGNDYGYKTFETFAKVYKHHVNKNPDESYGDVALSVYNPVFHRVELIVLLDNFRARDIVEGIENGDYPDWSMGCKVPYDVCMNCGNKAVSRKFYCECMRYYPGQLHPKTGRPCVVRNDYPRFFDISRVLIGADRIAKTLRKVASGRRFYLPSAELYEKWAEADKAAEIKKEVPAGAANPPAATSLPASKESLDALVRSIPEVKAREKKLPKEVLDALAEHPLPKSMSTMSLMGIVPKPQEFQRIFLIRLGKRDEADRLDHHNLCFDPAWAESPGAEHYRALDLDRKHFTPSIFDLLKPFMEDRSYAMPHLSKRIVIMIKSAAEEDALPTFIKLGDDGKERKPFGIIPVLLAAAFMYAALAKKAPEAAVGGLSKAILEHPGLAASLGIGAAAIMNSTAGAKDKGQFAPMIENPDASNIMARIDEQRAHPFLKVGGVGGNISAATKRIFLGIPAAYMVSGILQKHREANPYDQEGRIKRFIRMYPDVISGALAVDALAALKGKGTHALAGRALSSLKTASAQDYLSQALIWPVAFGGANLPGRVIGGLLDQAVLEASGKAVKKWQARKQSGG